MRIGILTHPLENNYGGLLQNWALQQVLKEFGHEPITLRLNRPDATLMEKFKRAIKIGLNIFGCSFTYRPTKRQISLIRQNNEDFINKHIIRTYGCTTENDFENLIKDCDLDAFIVGSDQVWRPLYCKNIEINFLSFVPMNTKKKVAYAASFGTSDWEFTPKQTNKCKVLLHDFSALSVREFSGVNMCKKYFDMEAEWVLDPTLLLEKSAYECLVYRNEIEHSCGDLFYYFLDETKNKLDCVSQIADRQGLTPFKVMPLTPYLGQRNINDYIYQSPLKWIRAFMDAKFVVTDSFHGVVFCIIFNLPFVVITNKGRGAARFESLLHLFELPNSVVWDESSDDIVIEPINWDNVNKIRALRVSKSLNFIKKHL